MSKVRDMTTGKPAKLIVAFALPIMLGEIFQQMYTMTDTAILSNFGGTDALGALGSADWLSWLVFGVISGFMQGFSILVAQRFGAGEEKLLRRAVSTIIVLASMIAVIFTAAGVVCAGPLLRLINTQERFFDSAHKYLSILYGGISVTAVYNLLSSLLRALGNSRTPLYSMIAASVVNVGLDLLFVIKYKWGVAGAAAATVIAQGVAAVICFVAVMKLEVLRFGKGEFEFNIKDARILCRLAAPMAFQNTMISVGGIALQAVINSLGADYVAGFTATNKMYGLLECAAISFGFAVTTYCGQNLGAKKIRRIKTGVRNAALIGFCVAAVITGIMLIAGRSILMIFIDADTSPNVLYIAVRYLRFMTVPLFILYMLHIYRSALQGLGNTVVPMFSGAVECAMRVGCAWLLTSLIGAGGIYFAEPAAWLGAVAILVTAYYIKEHSLVKEYGLTQ